MANNSIAVGMMRDLSRRGRDNFDLFEGYINPSFVRLMKVAGFGKRFVSSQGCEMVDDRGRRYLDFVGGYGTLNIGHNHPAVREALAAVIEMGLPGFSQVECGLLPGLAAEKLASLLPKGLNKVYFCSSGSEAVDAAIKLARAATGRKRIICCEGAFHGNTLGVLGMTDNPSRRDRFRPLLPGIIRVPFGDRDALAKAIRWKDAAAMVVEPVQGEGGAVVPAKDFLADASEICRRAGTLFILDEVQTGLGRTGKIFALEHWGLRPDAVALAKSLCGGFVPAGAMVAGEKVFARAYGSMRTCLDHKNTFSGGPLAMAAAIATLEVLLREGLSEKAAASGAYLAEKLRVLAGKYDLIEDVRGMGLLLGVQFRGMSAPGLRAIVPKGVSRGAAGLFAQHVVIRLLKRHGIITQVAANDFSVIKVTPPLTIERDDLDRFVKALDDVLSSGGHVRAMASLAKEIMKRDSP